MWRSAEQAGPAPVVGGSSKESSAPRRRRIRRAAAVAIAGLTVTATMAACSAGGAGTSTESGSSGTFLNYFPCCSWNTTWSYNAYNVNALTIQDDFITMRLAIQDFPSLTDYTPQLADKWTTGRNELRVHIRDDAKWQDGTPVTSKDLYDTVILNGTRGDAVWNDITDIKIDDAHTVTFSLRKGQPTALAENDILQNTVVYPSSVYGQFATADLAEDVKSYSRASQADPGKAAKMAEAKRIGDAFKKLAAYKVDKLIGDGPFTLSNITTKEAKLVKSDSFWAADKIKPAGLNWSNGSNDNVYPQLLSGNADFSNVYMAPPILKQWSGIADSHLALTPGFGFVIGFNSQRYPYNLTAVRQALAYIMPRQQMAESAYGTGQGAGGTWKEINTGISPSLEKLYLTQGQLDKLNKYPVDTDKATALLKSEGFTMKDGRWVTPKGQQFTMQLAVDSTATGSVTAFTSAAKALTAFGIKTEVLGEAGAQLGADEHDGDFDAGMFFVSGSNPLSMYDSMMGHGQNFSDSGNYAGKRGIGFGPAMKVPGLGKVNVPDTLETQSTKVAPGPEMKADTWSWAQLVNKQVPYIWYGTKVYQFQYSTKNFDQWPPVDENGGSRLWNIIGNSFNAGISLAMQQGYISPKS